MKYAFVIIETEASKRQVREQRENHRKCIEGWMGTQAQAGKVVGGEAFETENTPAITVRHQSNGEVTVTEEPFAGTRETLGGYILVEVANREEAIQLATSWPTEETIEIRPLWVAS